MTQVVLVTQAQVDKVEEAFDNKLGRYFKIISGSEVLDGSGSISSVQVDPSQFMQESGSGKFIINGDKIKRLYNNLTSQQKTAIDNRLGIDVVTWYNNNKVDFSTIIVSGSDQI